jgi:hypothetical protein
MSDPYKLLPGYAETATRKHPRSTETIVLGDQEIAQARYVGPVMLNGRLGWLAWKLPGRNRYYFQFRPW